MNINNFLDADSEALRLSDEQHGVLVGHSDPSRQFAHMVNEDDGRPPTPSVGTMVAYANPHQLPPSNGTMEEWGQRKRLYGSVRVLEEHSPAYDALRLHMASTNRDVRKHLAHAETRGYPITDVYPYSLRDQHVKMFGQDYEPSGPQTDTYPFSAADGGPGHTRVGIQFPVDGADFLPSGGKVSAATLAAHEMAHSARYQVDAAAVLHAPAVDQIHHAFFENLDERAVIDHVENPVARGHGEGARDSYDANAPYLAPSMTSTEATDPRAARIMDQARPELVALTQRMRMQGFPNAAPDKAVSAAETLKDLYQERRDKHLQVSDDLEAILPDKE